MISIIYPFIHSSTFRHSSMHIHHDVSQSSVMNVLNNIYHKVRARVYICLHAMYIHHVYTHVRGEMHICTCVVVCGGVAYTHTPTPHIACLLVLVSDDNDPACPTCQKPVQARGTYYEECSR